MISKKLFLVLSILLYLGGSQSIKAQAQVPIVLNEYCASNVTGPADNFGVLSDWVEIRNNQPEAVKLTGYYLSNDENNLFKWKFPSNFNLGPGEVKVIWLSGRDVVSGNNYHANFTLDQCKKQSLCLSDAQGVIMDLVPIQLTKAGHTRGRVDYSSKGPEYWKLYTTNSFLQQNPLINNYIDYTPKPDLQATSGSGTTVDTTRKTGDFLTDGSVIYKVTINGEDYDTTLSNFKCYNVYYNMGGDYPTPANWTRYVNVANTPITVSKTEIVRVITVPTSTETACQGYLPSFCETNTYFMGEAHTKLLNENFGIVSIALDKADENWFNSQGVPASTTIHVEYFDKYKQVSEGYGILNRPPHEAWLNKQKGFYVSIDDRYGYGCNFEGTVFNVDSLGTSKRTVFPTLHLKAGDHESASKLTASSTTTAQGTALRDVLIQSLAAKYNLNVSPLHIKPVRAFVNGKYWGVYNLTEVFDKYYENFYNGQPLEEVDMAYYYNGDASVSYPDGSISTYSNNFKATLYDPLVKNGGVSLRGVEYTKMLNYLDKSSFIDYLIMNSYTMNSDLWNFNLGFAKGGRADKPGNKWHYYLWNMPATLSYTASQTNTERYFGAAVSPCFLANVPNYNVSPKAHNAHGKLFSALFHANKGNLSFQEDYKIRYQDLLNGPLKCENILKQLTAIENMYGAEMRCHEDPACTAGPGQFNTEMGNWDTNMVRLRKYVSDRCSTMETAFRKNGCYLMTGPYLLTVDVKPAGSGKVKLNTLVLDTYTWTGQYYKTRLSFSAIPTATNYVFDHWEFKYLTPNNPVSSSSLTVDFNREEEVVAVFTDITNPISNSGEGANIPTGFTPNGDDLNDIFRPLGSGKFVSEYQMTIWNRWGEEVYRSTDAKTGGWDGNYKGAQAPTGVYAYIITYKDFEGSTKMTKGNVTLTR